MKSRLIVLLVVMCASSSVPAQEGAASGAPAGTWRGAIELPNGALDIAVTLEQVEGEWSGTIDIPAQGLRGFELSAVTIEPPRVHFEMQGIPGAPAFEGTLSESGQSIAGTFTQGQASLPFSLERTTDDEVEEELVVPATPVPGEGLAGDWMGALDVGPMDLRLALQVSAAGDDKWSATLDSVDQGTQMNVDSITLKAGVVELSIHSIGASYKGTMNEDGSAIDGTWSQGGRDLPLTLNRLAEPFALKRTQTPQPPFPYEATDVTFRNEKAKIDLAGTLVIPDGDGPFPAVVFVTGSGPQDRDEALMGHKPFLVVADHLARRGIASLRYDDRGFGASGGNHLQSTVGDFATDVESALAFLAEQPAIDHDATGIFGHSEGGLSAVIVASRNEDVDFLVLAAPPGEPLDALLMRQTEAMLRQQGIVDDPLLERVLAMQAEDIEMITDASLTEDELRHKLKDVGENRLAELSAAEAEQIGYNSAAIEAGIAQTTNPWFRSLLRENPAPYIEKVKVPVLALFGERDIQVDASVNAPIVEAALAAAETEDYEVHVLEELNHLFQHAETGAISEYRMIEETFAPEALELISDWITSRFGNELAGP